jgi:hypothetical protein
LLSTELGAPGFNDGSNPGLGAAIVAVSPTEIAGGAPGPAHVAADESISFEFSLAILSASFCFY